MEKELHILIIEDDPADAIRLTRELGRQGVAFRSTRVETRDDFIATLKQQTPDLVLSDHGLPTFSGFEALELIQQNCPSVPFVFVTGYYDQRTMIEMFEGGALGYVFKNRLRDLSPVIRQALEDARQNNPGSASRSAASYAAPKGAPQSPTEAKLSRDIILICSQCKKVRNEIGAWERLDIYLRKHEKAMVSLALCPRCAWLRYPGLQM